MILLRALHGAHGEFVQVDLPSATLKRELEDLKKLGYEIEAHPHRGCRFVSVPDKLFADDLSARLSVVAPAACLGSENLVFEETTSTNDVVARLMPSRKGEGTVVFAESQTKGRGRHGRVWASPRGKGLWFSVLLRPRFPLSRVTVAAGVAVARVVQATGVEALIKWPNDVTVKGRKISGILTEARDGAAILGIGLNVNCRVADFPEALREVATSLERETGEKQDRAALAVRLLEELNALYAEAETRFDSVSAEWARLCTTLGKQIAVRMGTRRIEGHAQALDEDGALLIRKDNGQVERVLGADLTLERE